MEDDIIIEMVDRDSQSIITRLSKFLNTNAEGCVERAILLKDLTTYVFICFRDVCV